MVEAALEVYVRRAYVAYTLTNIRHISSPDGVRMTEFDFHIPDVESIEDPEGKERIFSLGCVVMPILI